MSDESDSTYTMTTGDREQMERAQTLEGREAIAYSAERFEMNILASDRPQPYILGLSDIVKGEIPREGFRDRE